MLTLRRTRHPRRLLHTARLPRYALALLAVVLLLAGAAPALAEHEQSPDPYYDGGYADAAYGDPSAGSYGEPVSYDGGYSFVRNLRGAATLIQADGERSQLELNQPLLVGDRLWVSPGSMVEVLLSDGNLLRVDGDSEVVLEALAFSPDVADRTTLLRLVEGNLSLLVVADSLGDELPRFELPNATVYVGQEGRFRITSDRGDWSEVLAREGWAEVVTDSGSTVVRAGEEALVEGASRPRTALRQAGGYDALERWGQRLDAQLARNDYVDPSLRYAAAPLDDHGSWVTVGAERAWRPYVEADWRPYVDGRWVYTPAGLTWVPAESWGWVPYHYGTWDYAPAHGWVWYPGRTFSPAWVYWYWGPSHVAWVPVGYYSHRYRGHGFGLRFGVYGWAGGNWGVFADWNFCPTRYFGDRHQRRYVHDGRYWRSHYGDRAVPRGIITTDTRGVSPRTWRDPEQVARVLRTRPGAGGAAATRDGGRTLELPDVTPFVEGRRELSPEVRRRVLTTDPSVDRVAGTPLAPATAPPARTVVRRGGGGEASVNGPRVDRPRVERPRADVSGSGSSDRRGDDTRLRVTRPRTTRDAGRTSSGTARPEVSRPTVSRPTGGRPTDSRRNGSEPTVSRPGVSRPPAARPRGAGPEVSRPTVTRPAPARPTVSRPDGSRPDTSRPTVSRPEPERSNRVTSPRVRRSAPPAPSRQPRVVRPRSSSPSGDRGATTYTPPRSSRAGTSSEPPARRVVRGVRGGGSAPPPSSGERPRVTRPRSSAPRTSPPRVSRPQTSRPQASRPSTRRPGADRSSVRRTAPSRPGTSSPRVSRPSTSRPSTSRPSTSRPSASRPSASRPGTSRPSTSRPSRSSGSSARSSTRSSTGRSSAGSRSGSSARRGTSRSSGSRSRSAGTARRRGRDGDGG